MLKRSKLQPLSGHNVALKMEIAEEPINSADPAEDILPACSPETELEKVPAVEESTPSRPDGTCSSIVVPRETEATPATTSPSPGVTPETEEKAPVAEDRASTPEGYVTLSRLLSATGSPTRLRASLKRKQLSSPDGSEIAAGLVSTVKRHCGSASEPIHGGRLLGRMPYGPSSCAIDEKENQTSTTNKDGDLEIPPTTPGRADPAPDSNQDGESEDPIFTTPPEGDKPSGTEKDEDNQGEEDLNGNFLGQSDELVAFRSQQTPAETPAGTQPQTPEGPEAPGGNMLTPGKNAEWQPPESGPVVTSTPPSSPAAEEWEDHTIPPFQWNQPLNLSGDSRGRDFESPNGEDTRPYQRHLGRTSMRATDWTYYQAQDEANPTEYHPDWPTGMRELGPILIPAGSESSRGKKKIPPLSPTYVGRTLLKKIADIPQQKSWGNLQEQLGILQHMWKTDAAIRNDPDWANTLQRCREDPAEGYLYTVLPTGEVLPFSEAVAIAYEYPCTLGKEQEGLHKRLVYSSTSGTE